MAGMFSTPYVLRVILPVFEPRIVQPANWSVSISPSFIPVAMKWFSPRESDDERVTGAPAGRDTAN
jgi:hypothetical protein